jgi:hypothetical protein
MHAMKRLRVMLLLMFLATAARAADVPLRFERLDLLDGRTLNRVVIKSYDAVSAKLLVVADGKAMLVPVDLIPAPFGARLKAGAPMAGTTTAIVATRSTAPAAVAKPAPGPAALAADTAAADQEKQVTRHKQAAEARAQRYFQYEFKAGSDAISVTLLDLETDQPEAVDGWPDRYRTKGKAYVEFFDSKGRSFSRTTCLFEVITEQKPNQPVRVVDFAQK